MTQAKEQLYGKGMTNMSCKSLILERLFYVFNYNECKYEDEL